MSLHVFGVRHHGPGSARSLLAALAEVNPDVILVEGPADAQGVMPYVSHPDIRPPVALLVYAIEAPRLAAFYPFTTYSPEWQALRFAASRGLESRFIDLPQAIRFAAVLEVERAAAGATNDPPDRPQDEPETNLAAPPGAAPDADATTLREDPIALLAEAAGYKDHELWWEHEVERRRDATGLFTGILEAMAALRASSPPPPIDETRREAHMRQQIRQAQADGFQRIAVVCGAWHAPVLAEPGPATADGALLVGLRKAKVAATWVAWTNSRLSMRSGYGAGVWSPGWYEHLWTAADRHTIRWIARAAALLRAEDLAAAPSNVIEAVRLAEALAALRDRRAPGLAEMGEAIQTVLCGGDSAPMRLIRERLEIGEALGAVPADAPTVPLQQDLSTKQRRLRLPPSAEIKTFDLDLREPTDRDRSRLLHALDLIEIGWGKRQRSGAGKGTFHEVWSIQWRPELAVSVIEANVWGNTVEAAATARLREQASAATELPRLTALLQGAILAELPGAIEYLLAHVRESAAAATAVRQLMDALPPLARVARYGDVRQTSPEQVLPVIAALFERVVVGLPFACASLDDAAADAMVQSIDYVQESVVILDRVDQRAEWTGVLRQIAERASLHGLVRGRCCRLLLEDRAIDRATFQRLARLALAPVEPAAAAAAWISGVTRGSGTLLLQQEALWTALDNWLCELTGETFRELLPLLRRSFSQFQPAERRAMAQKLARRRLERGPEADATDSPGDELPMTLRMSDSARQRADRVLPVLAHILGVATETSRGALGNGD